MNMNEKGLGLEDTVPKDLAGTILKFTNKDDALAIKIGYRRLVFNYLTYCKCGSSIPGAPCFYRTI